MRALAATKKGLFELARGAAGWEPRALHFEGEPVSMMLFDRRDGAGYAALNLGHFGVKLHRRDAGAGGWVEVGVPVYPAQPDDRAEEPAWKLSMIWSLAAGGAGQPGVLWAGTLPGGLFRSTDRGEHWELVESLWNVPQRRDWMGGGYDAPGIHSICVDPRDANRLLVGVSCGGAWLSRDGGGSWTVSAKGMRAAYMPPERADDQAIQDPHCIVQCAAAPDVYWCQHHNGIWRSGDGAANWNEIAAGDAPSNFGFAVAAHPQDPQTAWFVPAVADQKRVPVDAALSVTRTRDGGRSFETLRRGLPQQHCYDLVYRHGLAVADDGRTLIMGSTTGGLWVSENGGDDWNEISAHLPPIYAVRFC